MALKADAGMVLMMLTFNRGVITDEKGGLMYVRRGFHGLLQRWGILKGKDLWTHGELQQLQ